MHAVTILALCIGEGWDIHSRYTSIRTDENYQYIILIRLSDNLLYQSYHKFDWESKFALTKLDCEQVQSTLQLRTGTADDHSRRHP